MLEPGSMVTVVLEVVEGVGEAGDMPGDVSLVAKSSDASTLDDGDVEAMGSVACACKKAKRSKNPIKQN